MLDTLYTTFEIGEENINFYFAETYAKIAKDMKKLVAGVLGSFCILRAILIFGVGWGNFDIFVLFAVGVFLWYLVLSSS